MKYLRETDNNSAYMPPDEFKTRRQIRNLQETSKETKTDSQQLNFNIKFQKKEAEDNHGVQRFKKAAHIIQDVIMLEHFSSNHEQDWILRKEAGVVFWINKSTGEVTTVKPWEPAKEGRRASTANALVGSRGSERSDMGMAPQRRPNANSPMTSSTKSQTPRSPRNAHATNRKDANVSGLKMLQKSSYKDEEDSLGGKTDTSEPEELGTGCLVYDGSEIENLFALLDTEK